jgi:hypothetical protein
MPKIFPLIYRHIHDCPVEPEVWAGPAKAIRRNVISLPLAMA